MASSIRSLLHQQTFFASIGESAHQTTYGLVIMGWGLVILLGLLYTLSPRLRKMLPRYFWNHRFYQEAIRRGREVIPVETTIILLTISGAAGLTAAVWIDLVQMSDAFTALVRSLPPGVETIVTQFIHRSWIMVILSGALTGLMIILWAGWLVLIANRLGQSIRYEQAFMLTVWPHWTLLLAAGLAWITAGTAGIASWILFFTWLLGAVYSMFRVWIDFHVVSRVNVPFIVVLALGSPICLLLVVVIVLATSRDMDVLSLWQLIVEG